MQIDHKMVNPAPGMAVSPVRVALPASRAKKPQCVAWIRISNSVVVFRHSFAAPRRDAPELCMNLSPYRGRGERRMPVAPAASCALCIGKKHTSKRVHRNHPAFPHAMVLTVSFALSPVTGLFCHRRPRTDVVPKPGRADITSANLTPASGRQDHTTSPYAATSFVSAPFDRSQILVGPALHHVSRLTLPRPPHPIPRP